MGEAQRAQPRGEDYGREGMERRRRGAVEQEARRRRLGERLKGEAKEKMQRGEAQEWGGDEAGRRGETEKRGRGRGLARCTEGHEPAAVFSDMLR